MKFLRRQYHRLRDRYRRIKDFVRVKLGTIFIIVGLVLCPMIAKAINDATDASAGERHDARH